MPLPIAHFLLGAGAVAAFHPQPLKDYGRPLLIGGILANAADFDFLLVFALHSKEWHRDFTHSLVFALLLGLLAAVFAGGKRLREAASYGAAYGSHCVLDFMTTKEGGGLELFFPFSDRRVGAGWWGLSELPFRLSAVEVIQALGLELVLFAPPLILLLLIRKSMMAGSRD